MHRRSLLIFCLAAAAAAGQQVSTNSRRVTVLSYNIHHGEGLDGKIDLPRIAGIITRAAPDFVLLQEVDRRTTRSGGVDQLAELAKLTGLKPYFGKTIEHQGGEYGNAVLTRGDVTESCNAALPGKEPRGLVSVRTVDGLLVFGTHFDVGGDHAMRLQSAAQINDRVAAHASAPAILAGDLNAVRGTPALDKLLESWKIAGDEAPTIPAGQPRRQIDFILVRPAEKWRVIAFRVLDEPVASDHRPVLATLELLPD